MSDEAQRDDGDALKDEMRVQISYRLVEELSSQQRRYRALVEGMHDVSFACDHALRLTFVNPAWSRTLGHSREASNGELISSYVVEDDRLLFERALAEPSARGRAVDVRLRHANGDIISMELSIQESRGGSLMGTLHDVTEQRAAEAELRQAKESAEALAARLEVSRRELERRSHGLEKANQQLREIASAAAHDLREPLRKIRVFAELLEHKHGDALEPKGRKLVRRTGAAARRLQRLVAGLRRVTDVSTSDVRTERLDLGYVVDEVLRACHSRVVATGATIEVGPLPRVVADRSLLTTLLHELVANALTYAREGVPLVVRIHGSEQEGRSILHVTDNGAGFDPAHADQIFEIFEQLGHGNDGCGVGLAIARRIAELHHGSLEASGQLGVGAELTLALPSELRSEHDG